MGAYDDRGIIFSSPKDIRQLLKRQAAKLRDMPNPSSYTDAALLEANRMINEHIDASGILNATAASQACAQLRIHDRSGVVDTGVIQAASHIMAAHIVRPRPYTPALTTEQQRTLITHAKELLVDAQTGRWTPLFYSESSSGTRSYRWPYLAANIGLDAAQNNAPYTDLLADYIIPSAKDKPDIFDEKMELLDEVIRLSFTPQEVKKLKDAIVAHPHEKSVEMAPLVPQPAPTKKMDIHLPYEEKLHHIEHGENIPLYPGECLNFILHRHPLISKDAFAKKLDMSAEQLDGLLQRQHHFPAGIIQKLAALTQGDGFAFWNNGYTHPERYASDAAKHVRLNMEVNLEEVMGNAGGKVEKPNTPAQAILAAGKKSVTSDVAQQKEHRSRTQRRIKEAPAAQSAGDDTPTNPETPSRPRSSRQNPPGRT